MAPEQTVSKDDLTYWRHIGKEFGITVQAWLPFTILAYACQHKSQEDQDPEVQDVVGYLEGSEVKPELWTMMRFQSEVQFSFDS